MDNFQSQNTAERGVELPGITLAYFWTLFSLWMLYTIFYVFFLPLPDPNHKPDELFFIFFALAQPIVYIILLIVTLVFAIISGKKVSLIKDNKKLSNGYAFLAITSVFLPLISYLCL